MPKRSASKVEDPQELCQAVHLIVMFAARKGGNLALEEGCHAADSAVFWSLEFFGLEPPKRYFTRLGE